MTLLFVSNRRNRRHQMSVTKTIVNAIYRALLPHEESVKRVQALFLWNRPVYSAVFLGIIEVLFLCAYFLPFPTACNFCIVTGSVIVSYCLYGAFPAVFDKLLSFEIKEVPADAVNRIRTIPEISAFLTTILSFWTKVCSLVFNSVHGASITNVVLVFAMLLGLFLGMYFIGDFWFVWLMFHMAFVLPGIVCLPPVQKWLQEEVQEDGNEAKVQTRETGGEEGSSSSSSGKEEPEAATTEETPNE